MTEVSLQQLEKQLSPNLVTDDGIVIEVKLWQLEKHQSPKLVTDEGMVIEVNFEQWEKQLFPNSVTGYFFPSQIISAGITISDWV